MEDRWPIKFVLGLNLSKKEKCLSCGDGSDSRVNRGKDSRDITLFYRKETGIEENDIVSKHSRQAETVKEARGSEKDSKNEDEREDES